jgi:hypothetical protein
MLEGNNGSSATIGIQSEAQGLSLQFGCNQPVVANASRIRFTEPEEANADIGLETAVASPTDFSTSFYAKGDLADLLDQMNLRGPAALPDMHGRWLNQTPQRTARWQWLDLTGDSQDDLLLLRTSTAQNPHLADLTILTPDEAGQFTLLHHQPLSSRSQPTIRPEIAATGDLTQNNLPDTVLRDDVSGQSFVVTQHEGTIILLPLPQICHGSLGILDANEDGLLEVVRDGCEGVNGRLLTQWNGTSFTNLP